MKYVFSFLLSFLLIFPVLLPVHAATTGTSAGLTGSAALYGTPSSPGVYAQIEANDEFDTGAVNSGGAINNAWNALALGIGLGVFGNQEIGLVKGVHTTGFQRSAIGVITSSIDTMYRNPPASTGEYIAYMKNKVAPLGAQPAYAAGGGIGYDKLNPVLGVWTVARNLAYLLLSVVFVVISFMIIFRVKIDPKTVTTLQSALPKIFLSFVLITFSYAIAGFIIDIMYVMISLVVNIAKGVTISGQTFNTSDISNILPTGSIFDVFGLARFFDTVGSSSAAVGEIVGNLINAEQSQTGGVASFFGFGASALAWLVIAAAVLYSLFKTWLSLLNAYIQIILGVITAPMLLMLDAIPGRSYFGQWLRNMFANTLVFPFVVMFLLVGYALTQGWSNEAGFVPPLLGGNSPGAIQGLIGLAVILTLPKSIDMLRDWLKAPAFKYGTAWAEGLQGGVGLLGRGYQGTGIPQTRAYYNEVQRRQLVEASLYGEKGTLNPYERFVGWASKLGTGVKPSQEILKRQSVPSSTGKPGG